MFLGYFQVSPLEQGVKATNILQDRKKENKKNINTTMMALDNLIIPTEE